jgi:hypothetical protein
MDALEAHLQRQIDHSRNFFWHRIRWQAVAAELRGEEFTFTDVGAGIGLVGELLAATHPLATYRFVEPLESLVTELEGRFGAAANANGAASYADSRYVTLLDVLEHIEHDREFLADLTSKMASGATLIMTVPALRRLWSSWDVALGHYRRYDKPMLREIFASLPLRVREMSYLFPEMLAPAAVRRLRSRAEGGGDAGGQRAEFPDLPPRVNELLYRVGTATLRARRAWPAGTSLLVIAERTSNTRVRRPPT